MKIVREGKQIPLGKCEIHLSGQDTSEHRKGYGWRSCVESLDECYYRGNKKDCTELMSEGEEMENEKGK